MAIHSNGALPVTTGAPDTGLVSPLLFKAFVMMSFVIIGPADDTGGFFVICGEKHDSELLFLLNRKCR